MRRSPNGVFRLRWMGVVVGALVLLVSIPLVRIWQNVVVVRLARENRVLGKKIDRVSAETAMVRIEIDRFLSYEAIERKAREKYHLQYPSESRIVVIHKSSPENSGRKFFLSRWLRKTRNLLKSRQNA